jgi:diphthine-ammonia ligase
MRVVVLVSGGKDSTCNMLKCVEHGHDIVALANLHPPRDAPSDELDSFMYQSVGHELIEAYAQCMRVPLYRRAIRGSSRVTSMQYAPTDAADEVEELFELLRDVCREHKVDAVACGTILSTYQRIRVENVCARLGLLALAFLWQREQSALLDEMLDQQSIDAVIIKTAAIGLGKAQLGRPLSQVRDTLRKLARQYGVHVCGEGGEYESFTLDCPLFHSRIVLDECATVVHSP